ncbi:MAG: HAMP domain-containing histidine kinase [Eubacterium sp.]|nr:HAMP domain-containing histidine kinase [Eubacterium sp.]
MNAYKNKEAKKYMVIGIAGGVAMAVLLLILMLLLHAYMRGAENREILDLIIETNNGEMPQDISGITAVLSGKQEGDAQQRKELREALKEYGYFPGSNYLNTKESTRQIVVAMGMFLVAEGLFLGMFYLYVRKRQSRLQELENYMDRIARGQYDLELEDNSDDELSNLKNHLFKLTLMLREQEQDAKKKKVALAESVSDISHQLKTPLSSIQILLDNMVDNPDMDEDIKNKFIAECNRQVGGMNWMIVSMLKLSRLDAGMVEFENKRFFVVDMIREAVDNLSVLAELRGLKVEYAPEMLQDITLCADYNWNREALQNIIKNALEHSDAGKNVTIAAKANDVYAEIMVINEGKPLSDKQKRQIFTRYYSEGKFEENSIGIGLPLAKAIIERQGGYLTVESNSEETKFILKYIF